MLYNGRMDTFSALSDPTRRAILEMLASEGALSATEICARFQVSPPAISQHLKALREAGLVHVEKRAQQRIYQINPGVVREFEEWARRLADLWEQRFTALDELLKVEKNRLLEDKRKE
jgi:DNA-binding transcriptional ArsR family regulator